RCRCCLPSSRETKTSHHGITSEIHFRTIFVAGLMIALGGVFIRLLHTPRRIMPFVFHSLVDGKGWDANASQAEVIGSVIMSSFGPRIRADVQPEFLRQGFDGREESSALRSRDLDFF